MENRVSIPFNRPAFVGSEFEYMQQAVSSGSLAGGGHFTKKCEDWFAKSLGCDRALMTPSCTAALELAALVAGIGPGDEVIVPSYTFVSTANAFALRGARIVFVDIDPRTMNISVAGVEAALSPRTRAVVPVHYAGVSCDMDALCRMSERSGFLLIEDAAQAQCATYRGEPVGSRGHMSCFSFHETKNFTAGGEGGMLCINDSKFAEQAEIMREKGTNRAQFFRGQVDKYTWQDLGSSFLPCEIQAAYLWAQLENADRITQKRLKLWNAYRDALSPVIEAAPGFDLQHVPAGARHNGHLFYVKCPDLASRQALIARLRAIDVLSVFHYVPLHSSKAGRRLGEMRGPDRYTTPESERVVRLPMYFDLATETVEMIVEEIRGFVSESTGQ